MEATPDDTRVPLLAAEDGGVASALLDEAGEGACAGGT